MPLKKTVPKKTVDPKRPVDPKKPPDPKKLPRVTKPEDKNKVSDDKATASVPTANQFAPLEKLDDEQVEEGHKAKIPPIVIKLKDDGDGGKHYALIDELKKELTKVPILKYSKDKVTIFTQCEKDYYKLKNQLEGQGAQHHTYTPKWLKTKHLVLKGMPRIPEEKVKEELETLDVKVVAVKAIKKKDKPMSANPVFLVTLHQDENIGQVKKVHHLAYVKISWEAYQNKRGLTQCHRCQEFGHGTSNCHNDPKCVKCAGDHETRLCQKLPKDPPKCVNCGEAHPANYSACTAAVKYLQALQKRARAPAYRTAPANNNNNYPPMRGNHSSGESPTQTARPSYSSAAKTSLPEEHQIGEFVEIMDQMNKLKQVCNLSNILNQLKELNSKLANCQNEKEQLMVFINATK